MSAFGQVIYFLIPYFTPSLVHCFYNSKTRDERLKQISDSESASKNQLTEKNVLKRTTLKQKFA